VDDDPGLLAKEIDNALQNADLLLLTGGVSVGDYDFVAKALDTCGVQTIFHKVRQRPGKPLLFGKKEETVVFGLPGNPSSVLTCFFEYVLPAIEQLMQLRSSFITTTTLPMLADYEKNGRLTVFLKATHIHEGVLPLGAQESFKMRSFAVANCLIVVDESGTGYKKGDMAEVHLLHRFTG
jgi:molybdopterin molybdotransferase